MLTVQKTGGLVSKGIVHTLDIYFGSPESALVKVRQSDECKAGHTSLKDTIRHRTETDSWSDGTNCLKATNNQVTGFDLER